MDRARSAAYFDVLLNGLLIDDNSDCHERRFFASTHRSDYRLAVLVLQLSKLPSHAFSRFIPSDVTYAIAGGFGGAGQSTVDRMFDCGARNFAFFSRSGDSKPDAK